MVTSSAGLEAEVGKKYANIVGKDVIANDIINYWRVEPIMNDSGEVTGTRLCNLNIFDPKGNIPTFALNIIN